jgi:predicted O-linked N-acetylglucosamine transferase (SPINDLY family)
LDPEYATSYLNLGVTLQELGSLLEAKANYERAIALNAQLVEAHSNLGVTLQELGQLDKSVSRLKQAIALKPDFADACNNLGNSLRELGRYDEASASYTQAIALNSGFLNARSNLLFLNASVRYDATTYLEEAQAYSDIVAGKINSPYSSWSCSPDATSLRVGFVSGDFKAHPVGYFLEGLLRELQSSSVELYAYPTNEPLGELTERLKALFHSWVPISSQSDKDAAQNIHNDGIHILIDLSGHTSQNRLPVFGWRPAPIQISWLGYFASTGLPEMDYILGDPFVTPKSEAHHFTEKIWQLPESYLCFTPPDEDLPVSTLPAQANGFVTFGCFNSLSRMTDEVVSVRAEILRAVPNSKLFLKDKRLDHGSGRDQILSKFAAHGIDESRLLLEGRSSREEYLACYHRVDIALSPFPYGGGTTSIEGLWMGVPVITKKGTYFLSHLGESIAHNTSLSDWIAADNEDYVKKAVKFSSDLSVLEELRYNLREDLLKTPLYDLPRFAKHFESILWEMKDLVSSR